MPVAPIPPVDELLSILTRDIIAAVADRPQETEARRQARAEGVTRLIEAFEPENGVEIMLAGQTVLLQNLLLDSVHDSRQATTADGAYRHRQQALSMAKVQLSFLKEFSLRHPPRAPADVPEEVPEAMPVQTAPPAETAAAAPPARPPAPEPRPQPRPSPAPMIVARPVAPPDRSPIPEAPRMPMPMPAQSPPTANVARPAPAT